MKRHYSGKTSAVVVLCNLFLHSAVGQLHEVDNDQLSELVRSASARERAIWWSATEQLGVLARGDPTLREEIWRRAHVNTLGMRFVRVEPGTFTMGPDLHRIVSVQKAHQVKITKAFYLAATEVTNEQFSNVFRSHLPDINYSPDADSPVVRVSWEKASEFCRILSEREDAQYRLPTEAEWEYACRAGTKTLYSYGKLAQEMSQYGWCLGGHTRAAPVGTLKPNAWGIYDMHGNVFEWVHDFFSDEYYAECARQGIVQDPLGPDRGSTHVLRSCGWQVENNHLVCTCTARLPMPIFNKRPFDRVGMLEGVGFRIVREPSKNQSR